MSETKICPHCGGEILAVAKKCKLCGRWLDEKDQNPATNNVKCPICDESIPVGSATCPECGELLTPVNPAPEVVQSESTRKKKSTWCIIAILGGLAMIAAIAFLGGTKRIRSGQDVTKESLALDQYPAHGMSGNYHFEGKIGEYPIHMELLFKSDYTVSGSYKYDSQRAKGNDASILVRGTYSGSIYNYGTIALIEYGTSGKEIGFFNCELSGGHETLFDEGVKINLYSIYGNYRNHKSGKDYDVDLICSETFEL